MKTFARRCLKGLAWSIIAVALILGIATGLDSFRAHRLISKAEHIHTGDSIDAVISLMGQPDGTYSKGSGLFSSSEHKALAYGRMFDWSDAFHLEFPFFYPINLRIFGPFQDDIAVILDDADKVLKVEMPKGRIPTTKLRPTSCRYAMASARCLGYSTAVA